MLGPLGHIGSWLAYQARRGARRTADQSTLADLAPPPLPPGLDVAWIGTAGFRLRYQGTTIWIDPYLTRLPLGRFARHAVTAPDDAAVAAVVDAADAVLIGHTHFDHALDAPIIAARTGCKVYGSSSMAHLMKLHGRPDLAVTVEPYRAYEVGPFRIEFVPSVHSKLGLGLFVPSGGELTCDHLDELSPQQYKCGQVWGIAIEVAGVRLYHQGSADFIADAIRHKGVDVFLCGIAGRRFTPGYAARIIRALDPRVIVPSHYDDFFRPLDAPMTFSMNVNVAGFADEVHAVTRDVALHALPRLAPTPPPALGAQEATA